MTDGRLPTAPGSRPTGRASKAVSPVPASIPSATCHGKRSFSSHQWATRGLRAIEREHSHDARRGHLHVYKCDECFGWHIGRGFNTRKDKRRQNKSATPPAFGRSAAVFAEADRIAKVRFPNGANASQLSQLVREVLASAIEARRAETVKQGSVHESAVAESQTPKAKSS